MINVILFDLWNTLIYDNSGRKPARKFADFLREAGKKNPYEFVDRFMCTRQFESVRHAAEYVSQELGRSPDEIEPFIRGFHLQKPEMFPDVIPNLKRLRREYKIALISNIGDFGLKAVKKIGLEKMFDHCFYSNKVGMIKQNPEFFRHALREMGVKPEEALMVGDCKFADIDPAEGLGIVAVLIKREGFPIAYVEKENFKRTIKTLDELDRFLRT